VGLCVAHRPFLKNVAQTPARGHRYFGGHSHQARAVLLNEAARAHFVVVLEHTQADGCGLLVPLLDQLDGGGRAAVGANPAHMQLLAQKVVTKSKSWVLEPRLMLTTCFMVVMEKSAMTSAIFSPNDQCQYRLAQTLRNLHVFTGFRNQAKLRT
jgi:hypothetical protein